MTVRYSLGKKLLDAPSVEAFLDTNARRVTWRSFASLKRDVDNLVHSDLKQASALADRIEELSVRINEPPARAFAEACRARVLHLVGRHRDANPLYRRAGATLKRHGLELEAAMVQKQEVDSLTHTGRYREALDVARAARRVLARHDQVQAAQLEVNVGNVYYMLDRYRRALVHYDRARRGLTRRGDACMRALVDMSRANVLTDLDRPDDALMLLRKAASALERAGQFVVAAQSRYHIAYLHYLRGNYNTGLAGYYEIRDRLGQLGSVILVAWCDLESAEILLTLNAFDDAAENAERARDRFDGLGMPYESARSRMIAALAAMGRAELDKAESNLKAARKVFARARNSTFTAAADVYLAEVALERGNAAEALERAELARRVFARQGLTNKAAHARLLAARSAFLSNDHAVARRRAASALRMIEGRYSPAVTYRAHHLIGEVARLKGNNREALESFLRAVETVEQMRGGIGADEFKATFLSGKIQVYEDAIAACLDEGSPKLLEEAFRLVESSKSRALVDLLARYLREQSGARKTGRSRADKTRDKLTRLIADLNWYSSHAQLEDERGGQRRAAVAERYGREITRCEQQIAQLFRRLEAEAPSIDVAGRGSETGIEELQASLEPDEIVVEFFTTGDEISAFIMCRDQLTVSRGVASRREIERLLSALRFQIEKFNYGPGYTEDYFEQLNSATNQFLTQLYLHLLARFEHDLSERRLIIIPHGPLHYVPFHALVNRRGYLVDQYEISYAPSATVLALCRARGRQFGRTSSNSRRSNLVALGLAQPDVPKIADEIQSLASLFPDSITLTGRNATRRNLLKEAPRARFLHLASHGYFRRDNPMFSFLKLADSQLNFYSLLDLNLSAEMVTLSACHTGVNRVFPGDELHGLMRGFLHAGAPSLVASLWASSDASTTQLMKNLYRRISEGESKRAALREAQLAVKDDYGHPYYWAPFILMGNPN
jgi:CHAT domain-containing protein/tetratricopeptide (TPR) repeat protein